ASYTVTVTYDSGAVGSGKKLELDLNSGTNVIDAAGNVAPASTGAQFTLPAGIAGEPINLGLTVPSSDEAALFTVTIADVPSGWYLSGGTPLAAGSVTVHTGGLSAL